ncbi:MAG: HAD-IIIA family hydrolase, partial [Candidatus Thiodiazotropha sp. (ex Lucinoma borealis)]|nr:HAD-IIIA family hydrolase [Candidatus Thiodiazotropha sp. (ex Lucinoma borealis)]
MQDIHTKASGVKLVIFDVDGVLTDGSLYLGDDGQEYKAFNSRDGHGMKMLQKSGVVIGIITGRTSEVVRIRMEGLGIEHVYQGKHDKLPAYQELRGKLGLTDGQVAYVGDDVVDLPIMRRVGLAIAVNDAHPFVIQ